MFSQDSHGLPLYCDSLIRRTRRKPENRDLLSTSLQDRGGVSLCRVRIETHHAQYAQKEDAHGQSCSNHCPHHSVLPIHTIVLLSSHEPYAVVSKKGRCFTRELHAQPHQQGKLLPVFIPSHSNWEKVQQQGHQGSFLPSSIQGHALPGSRVSTLLLSLSH